MAETIPLSVPDDLLSQVRLAAERTKLSVQEVLREATRLGLPRFCEQSGQTAARLTNVDPLPDDVLRRIYSRPEEDDEEGVRRFIAAQSLGGED